MGNIIWSTLSTIRARPLLRFITNLEAQAASVLHTMMVSNSNNFKETRLAQRIRALLVLLMMRAPTPSRKKRRKPLLKTNSSNNSKKALPTLWEPAATLMHLRLLSSLANLQVENQISPSADAILFIGEQVEC